MEMNLDHYFNNNHFLTTVIVDFSAKWNKWPKSDRSTKEGSKIDFLTSKFGFSQIIKEPLVLNLFLQLNHLGTRIYISSLTIPKFSPSNNICQISFESVLSPPYEE